MGVVGVEWGVTGWGEAGVSEFFYFASKLEIKKIGGGGGEEGRGEGGLD